MLRWILGLFMALLFLPLSMILLAEYRSMILGLMRHSEECSAKLWRLWCGVEMFAAMLSSWVGLAIAGVPHDYVRLGIAGGVVVFFTALSPLWRKALMESMTDPGGAVSDTRKGPVRDGLIGCVIGWVLAGVLLV